MSVKINGLNQYRSWIVRGIFLHSDWTQADVQRRAKGRPFGNQDDGTPVYFCQRSKQKKISTEVRLFSIGDMGKIADELFDVNELLSYIWYAMRTTAPDNSLDRQDFRASPN